MGINISNPQLQQLEQATLAKVSPKIMNSVKRIEIAGHKIMYSPDTQNLVKSQLQSSSDPSVVAGQGVAKMLAIIMHHAKGTLNMQAAIPACQILLCEVLDFMEQIHMVQVTPDLIAQSVQEMYASVMKILKISPQQVQAVMSKGQQQMPQGALQAGAQPPAGGVQPPTGGAQPPSSPQGGGIIGSSMGA